MPRVLASLSVVLALLWSAPALAWDPALGWHTLETPHFVVHYHDGLGPFAQRCARALEAAHARLVPVLGHAPEKRVQVVVSDTTDGANGSATAWMRTVVNLYAVPPDSRSELNDYEDYVWNLVVHEYTHILHLDDIRGLPSVVNSLIGQLWVPNGLSPRWYIEGLAVYQESAFSGGGRARSSIYDMYLHAQVLEGGLYGLDDATGYPSTWPRGGTAYLHGARFMQWIADGHGASVFARINHDYGSQVIPYAVNATAKDHLGQGYIELYRAWQNELTAAVESQAGAARQRGLTDARRLTFAGEGTGEPVFLDSKTLLYLEDSADRRAAVRRISLDGTGDAKVRQLYGSGTLAISPDGRRAVVSQIVSHREFYWFEDLFSLDLESGSLEQLTFGKRLTEPSYAPDGRSLVAAQRLTGGRMALVSVPASGGEERILYAAPERHAVYTPRFSPDGRRIAFSEQRPEGRDLRVLDLDTGTIEDVTRDRALDLDPVFDPTGRWLVFASDRTGIYNLYAFDRSSRKTFQVTEVLTGAFRPAIAPDGRTLAFVSYSRLGYDVSVTRFSPETFREAPEVDLARPKPPAWERNDQFPAKAYQPLETMRPLFWLPLLGSDASGLLLGITTQGGDVVGKHSWSLEAAWGLSSNEPSVSAGYSTKLLYPDLSLAAGTYLTRPPGAPEGVNERQYYGAASLSFPFTGLDHSWSAGLGYELRYYDPWDVPIPSDPLADPPYRADRGLNATLSLGLGFSNVQHYANGISPERGFAFNLNLRSGRPEWGSDFLYYAAEASLTGYLPMPWLEHHALAMKLSGGYAVGELGRRRSFWLGGIHSVDPLLNLIQYSGIYGAGLRGYPVGAFAGDAYTLGNVEYRFPLVTVDRGLWTLPFYLRRLHAAVTFDVGEASDKWTWRGLRPSVGAELRAELYLGYGLYTGLRLGYARGLGEGGVNDVFFGLGNSF